MTILDIDVTKLDKNRFRIKGAAKYCDLVLIDCPRDNSDGFVKQGISKEDREAGVEMPIIGNFRRVGGDRAKPPRPARDPDLDQPEDDIPF